MRRRRPSLSRNERVNTCQFPPHVSPAHLGPRLGDEEHIHTAAPSGVTGVRLGRGTHQDDGTPVSDAVPPVPHSTMASLLRPSIFPSICSFVQRMEHPCALGQAPCPSGSSRSHGERDGDRPACKYSPREREKLWMKIKDTTKAGGCVLCCVQESPL